MVISYMILEVDVDSRTKCYSNTQTSRPERSR